MNPFSLPERVYVSKSPQDMRAGLNRLSYIVTTEFGRDATDGSLYVFISRRGNRAKMLRFLDSGWCLYHCTLCEGTLKWRFVPGESCVVEIEPRQLLWLLEGLEPDQPQAVKPVAARNYL